MPWHLDTRNTSSQAIPSTSHAWTYQHESLNITVPATSGAPTTALNNDWIPSHFISDGAAHYWYVMGYYERLGDRVGHRHVIAEGHRHRRRGRGAADDHNLVRRCEGVRHLRRRVYVITPASGAVARIRDELRNPHGVAVTPDGRHAYVTDTENDAVVVVDTTTLRAVGRTAVGRTPWNTAFSPDGSRAYVTNANDNTVSVIDTGSRRVTTTIPLGAGTTKDAEASFTQINHIPTAIALGPDGDLWVACNASSSLVVIDPSSNTVRTSIDLGLGDEPTGIPFA